MKVVMKHGKTRKRFVCTCKECGCVFTCEEQDVEVNEGVRSTKCPECGMTVEEKSIIEKIV